MSNILDRIILLSKRINILTEENQKIKNEKKELYYVIKNLSLKNIDIENTIKELNSRKELKKNYKNEIKKIINKYIRTTLFSFLSCLSVFSLAGVIGIFLGISIISAIVSSILLFSVVVPSCAFLVDYIKIKTKTKEIDLVDIDNKINLLSNQKIENDKLIKLNRKKINFLNNQEEKIELNLSLFKNIKEFITTHFLDDYNLFTNNKSENLEEQKVKKLDNKKNGNN